MNHRTLTLIVGLVVVALSTLGFNKAFGYGGSGGSARPAAAAPVAAAVTKYVPVPINYPAVVRSLSLGAQGEDVTNLQRMLRDAGFFNGEPTGFYGQETLVAVKAYQLSRSLPSVGVVGPQTMAELNKPHIMNILMQIINLLEQLKAAQTST